MKNYMRSALFALLSITAAGSVHAATTNPRLVWDQVRVRTYAAANPAPGFVDSAIFRAVSVESNPAGILDTTVAFSTQDWFRPVNINGATDSTDFCVLVVSAPQGEDCGATFDSLGVAVQVSANGQRWATAVTFKGGTNGSTITTGNNQVHVNGVFQEQLSVNAAGVAPKMWIFKFKNKVVNMIETPDIGGLSAWPYIRFVLRYADGTDGVILEAKLGHYETTDN